MRQKLFAAGVRGLRDQRFRVLGESLFPCQAGPAPNLAIRNQGQAAQIAAPARVAKFAEQILKSKLQAWR